MKINKKFTLKNRQNMLGYAFVTPWIIGFLVFALYPIIYSFYLSLNSVSIPAEGIKFSYIGFKNYQGAFVLNRVMIIDLGNFLKEAIIMMIVINVFALIFALILNMRLKGRNILRTIFFVPVVVVSGPVITELVKLNILVLPGIENFRVIQMFSEIFGHQFGNAIVDIFSNLIYMFWFSGVQIIVFLAILQKLNTETYEAAEIDGASPWESFWKLTLPSLKPIILINMIYTFMMLATFANNEVIKVIMDSRNKEGYGFSAALSYIYFAALMIVIIIIIFLFNFRIHALRHISFYSEGYVYNNTRYEFKDSWLNKNRKAVKVKRVLIGRKGSDGIILKAFIYVLIIGVAFTFLYPFLYLVLKSFQSPEDVLSPIVNLIPSHLYLGNFTKAFKVIGFWSALKTSLSIAFFPSISQVISTALIGYGLSRFNFKGKNIIIILILFTFIIPPQVLMLPTYLFYKKLHFTIHILSYTKNITVLGSVVALILPALFGQGIKSAIFIMIFYQIFNMVPKVLDEAAEIDGASPLRIFFKIALPLAVPAIIVVFLFSFVWYWNETYLTSLYLSNLKTSLPPNTLPNQLANFASSFRSLYPDTGANGESFKDTLNEAIYMAGTLVSILPLLFIYFILQRWFVEGVDRSGITGE